MNKWRPSQLRSFYYAFSGFSHNLKYETNFRIQFIFGIIVVIAGFYFSISRIEWLIILLTIAAVWSAELVNTSIEMICDKITADEDHLVKIVKDSSAAAVLITSIIAAIVGVIIFLPYVIVLL